MELTANKMEPYTMVRLVIVTASGRKTVQATNANQRLMTTGTSSKTNRRTMTTFPVLRRHSLSKVFPHHLTTSTSSPKPINRTTFHERRNRKVARVFSKKPERQRSTATKMPTHYKTRRCVHRHDTLHRSKGLTTIGDCPYQSRRAPER